MSHGNDHNRYRNTSVTFRVTPEEKDAVHYRSKILGLPLQEVFFKTFNNQPIELTMGLFDSDRISIELKKLRRAIEQVSSDDEKVLAEIKKCRICLEQVQEIFTTKTTEKEAQDE